MSNEAEPKNPRPSPLERLRRGEIDRNGYLDAKVREATAHLRRMPPSDLLTIRSTLRELLETEPVLMDLVRRVTAPEN